MSRVPSHLERSPRVAQLDELPVPHHPTAAHADQAGLLDYAESVRRRGKLRRVILVHGEPGAQAALMKELDERGFPTVDAPSAGQRIRL